MVGSCCTEELGYGVYARYAGLSRKLGGLGAIQSITWQAQAWGINWGRYGELGR